MNYKLSPDSRHRTGAVLRLLRRRWSTSDAKKEAAPPPAASAPAVDEANAATVAGKVSFEGTKPVMRALSMDATPACARAHTTP